MLNGNKNSKDDISKSSNSLDDHSLETDVTSVSASSPASPGVVGKVLRGTEKRRSLKSVKILESDTETDNSTKNLNDKTIQERPLPELPPKQ